MQLSPEFIEKQKTLLLNEKERLVKEVNDLDRYPDYGDQEDDNVLELQDYENNESVDDNLKILLAKVNAALKSIEDDTYGKCSKCAEAIDEDRLAAMPWVDICVNCATEK